MAGLRCLWLLLAGLLALPVAVHAGQVKIRVTTQLPLKSPLGVNLVQFKEEVEDKSGRAISFEIFDKSRLYQDDQVLGAVSSGAIEMGVITLVQFHEKVRAIEVFDQPFLFNFEALVRAATHPHGELRNLLDKAVLDRTGVRILWWQAFGSGVIFSKGQDARSPAAIRGKKIRVPGENQGEFIRRCGGIPVLMVASKQLEAVRDGTVDMVVSGVTSVASRDLWKATDAITRTDHAAFEFLVIINEKVWQSLEGGQQAIITAAARRAEQDLRLKIAEVDAKAYAFARAKGMKVHELSPDEVAEWRACSAGILDDFMGAAGDLGSQAMAAYGKLRTDPCCTSGPKGQFTRR
jgi:C4-dicarboxylate-binding protein DctP